MPPHDFVLNNRIGVKAGLMSRGYLKIIAQKANNARSFNKDIEFKLEKCIILVEI